MEQEPQKFDEFLAMRFKNEIRSMPTAFHPPEQREYIEERLTDVEVAQQNGTEVNISYNDPVNNRPFGVMRFIPAATDIFISGMKKIEKALNK